MDVSKVNDLSQDYLHELNHEYWTIKEKLDNRLGSQIERFLTLRQIATSFGPSLVISPVIYVTITALTDINKLTFVSALVVAVSLCTGVFLCAQSHYRATQVALVLAYLFADKIEDNKPDKDKNS